MALTAKERRMVEELTERQRQLEMIVGRALGGSLGERSLISIMKTL